MIYPFPLNGGVDRGIKAMAWVIREITGRASPRPPKRLGC